MKKTEDEDELEAEDDFGNEGLGIIASPLTSHRRRHADTPFRRHVSPRPLRTTWNH